MTQAVVSKVALALALAGCGDNLASPGEVAVDAPSCPTRTIFFNRHGGIYTRGFPENASINQSTLLDQDTRTIAAPTVAESDWTAVLACVRAKLAPFAVVVTDRDPGMPAHVEVAIIDDPAEVGQRSGVQELAPRSCEQGTAQPKLFERGIAFVVWGATTENADRCWIAARAIASAYGLDHAASCPDLMSLVTGCGPDDDKTFTDADVDCGEDAPRQCICGGLRQQNSFQYLLGRLGPACP